jgi:predicted nucleic acid-binding protein
VTERVFVDTNVFVYAEDANEPAKRTVARQVIREVATKCQGVLSTQVLMEYTSAARKRLGLSIADCRQAVLLMTRFDVALIRPEHVLGALDLAVTHSFRRGTRSS